MTASTNLLDCFRKTIFRVTIELFEFLKDRMTAIKLGQKQMLHGPIRIIPVLFVFAGLIEPVFDICGSFRFLTGSGLHGIINIGINNLRYRLGIDAKFFPDV